MSIGRFSRGAKRVGFNLALKAGLLHLSVNPEKAAEIASSFPSRISTDFCFCGAECAQARSEHRDILVRKGLPAGSP